ncbi:MAG: hypothetical protein D4R63_10455 [Methylococcaceae bacterium]|nr:MAG: hypothetical protein D4R63_10455 [Methylococcaceae bacterium]
MARPCRRNNGLAYIVECLLELSDDDYEYRSGGGVTTTVTFSNRINQIATNAAQQGLIPVHLHSHPAGIEHFSGYDDHHEELLHQWLQSQGQPLLISLVQAVGSEPRARLWLLGHAQAILVRNGLQVFSPTEQSADLPALARQKVFGKSLRLAASQLQIAIIGVGGIGMLVAEQLARAGFTRFVLVDHDKVEPSNLNRLPNLSQRDLGRLKVKAAKSLIQKASRAIGTNAQVHALPYDIYTAPKQVKKIVSQCDVILALTDNELSRISCLDIALDAGAEFLMAGVDIRLNEDGQIVGLFAEVSGAEEGRYCPLCTGRLDSGQASLDARQYVGGEVWDKAQTDGYIKGIPDPSVMSLNSIAAGALVLEIQRRVAGLGVRDLWQMNYQESELVVYDNIERNVDDCMVCR